MSNTTNITILLKNHKIKVFAIMLEESISKKEMRPGELITAEVVSVQHSYVIVNAGLKSESYIPLEEFKNDRGDLEVNVGDFVSVAIESVEDGYGETKLSRDKAKRLVSWTRLEKAMEDGEIIKGIVNGRVKGGLTVLINGIRAFLPGSLIDLKPIKDTGQFEGKELELKVIKIDKKRNNVVVSRKAVLELSAGEDRTKLIESLTEGSSISGVIKNITDYGAFVDLGGIDGLLHITDLAWRRIKHPSEVLNIGDEITAIILKYDQEKNRVSLGLKQLETDPWSTLNDKYPISTKVEGVVTNLTDYGAFVEIEPGIEGLVHVSEMDWTNKSIHPRKVVQLGDSVKVAVLEIDSNKRRISLGMKQCHPNPWEKFTESYKKSDIIEGPITSITDFGIFVGLEGGIDGLIHMSDVTWDDDPNELIKSYKKGDNIKATILQIDIERERISLGLKQMNSDPIESFISINPKGTILNGVVKDIDDKGATIKLSDEVDAYMKNSESSMDHKVKNISELFQIGDEINGMINAIDKKNRTLSFSVKQREKQDFEKVKSDLNKESSKEDSNIGKTSLGALLKARLDDKNSDDENLTSLQ